MERFKKNYLFLQTTIDNLSSTDWWKYIGVSDTNYTLMKSLMTDKVSSARVECIFFYLLD